MSENYKNAEELLAINIEALQKLKSCLDESFNQAVDLLAECINEGRKIIITGLGKSFHIGHKIAATLTSTGSNAFMLHPAEAFHGDLGLVSEKDVVIALSYSGESTELLKLIPQLKIHQCPIISITGAPNSELGKESDIVLPITIKEEACPFNLAPTTSAMLTLVLGDLLAMGVLAKRSFSKADYAKLHPGGSIGNTLTTSVKDIMRTGERVATVTLSTSVNDAVLAMTSTRNGAVAVVSQNQHLEGLFTDGDFRRLITARKDFATLTMKEVLNKDPITVSSDSSVVDLMRIFETHKINCVVITNTDETLAGIVDLQDMPKMKLL